MARPLRVQYPGALYHITARGNERKAIFRSDEDRETFLAILAQAVERYRLILHAYVLMDNHYHLLLETKEANLSLALRHLNGVYTSSFNRTHQRAGHLFQGRYKAILVEKESYLLELSRYIHLNPIRVKMDIRPERYAWSSYRDYIGSRTAPGWLTREALLGTFGRENRRAEQAYRKYVEEGVRKEMETPWKEVVGQVVLGGEGFLRSVQTKLSGGRNREVPSRRGLEVRPTWEEIKKRVQKASPELMALKTGNRSNPVRAVLIYLGRERGGLSLRELAEHLDLEASTVSQTAGRVARLRLENKRWERILQKIEKSLIPNS